MNAFDDDDENNDDDLLAADDRESKLYCVKALCNWSRRPENAKRLSAEGELTRCPLLSYSFASTRPLYQPLTLSHYPHNQVLSELSCI